MRLPPWSIINEIDMLGLFKAGFDVHFVSMLNEEEPTPRSGTGQTSGCSINQPWFHW